MLQQLGGLDVVARDVTIDGRAVRCFEFGAADGDGEICVTKAGVPVRASVGESSIELVHLEASVDDDVFELPAEITSAPE